MLDAKVLLLATLGVVILVYLTAWYLAERERHRASDIERPIAPDGVRTLIGFGTNFFDTLGIGSFATTTSLFRFLKTVRDEKIPGTLNVGHTPPTFVQALIYTVIIEVDMTTLVAMIVASVLGAWLGAGIVAHWPRRKIQVGMGSALLGACGIMLMQQLQWMPAGSEALGVEGGRLAIGIVGNFVLGALMTLGIGLYAPCMILISLLGMNAKTAFPIMMGSCAFLMPVASVQFIRSRAYDLRATLGLALGGVPAVLIAAYLVKELPLYVVRWLVIGVVVYTATMLLRTAIVERAQPDPAPIAT